MKWNVAYKLVCINTNLLLRAPIKNNASLMREFISGYQCTLQTSQLLGEWQIISSPSYQELPSPAPCPSYVLRCMKEVGLWFGCRNSHLSAGDDRRPENGGKYISFCLEKKSFFDGNFFLLWFFPVFYSTLSLLSQPQVGFLSFKQKKPHCYSGDSLTSVGNLT